MFQNLTPVVKNIVIINVVVFIAAAFSRFIEVNAPLYDFYNVNFQPYQFLTSMFMHGGLLHILFNMLALSSLGGLLERFIGDKKFILLYFSAGICGGLLHNLIGYFETQPLLDALNLAISDFTQQNAQNAFHALVETKYAAAFDLSTLELKLSKSTLSETDVTYCINSLNEVKQFIVNPSSFVANVQGSRVVGASGAVMGVFTLVAFYFPNSPMQIMFIPFPIKAKHLLVGFVAFSLLMAFNPQWGGNIAHWAHLGGVIPGVILYLIWRGDKNSFY